ncbi:hypothetical protein GUJ93_ZPchr0006g40777 [Zizania palustris]|uniref:Uncharacterized protein n=1 Tax=Zizania palustris TaxID=103762 RepID=A0A8J5TC68_ZIZPA|nr:hypothetical protein GUJ93_ZPchr0006g40777 [Zizania palustris]
MRSGERAAATTHLRASAPFGHRHPAGCRATQISSSSPPYSLLVFLVRGDATGNRRCKGPSAAYRRVYLLGLWRLGAMAAPPFRARADYDYLIKLLLIGDSGFIFMYTGELERKVQTLQTEAFSHTG